MIYRQLPIHVFWIGMQGHFVMFLFLFHFRSRNTAQWTSIRRRGPFLQQALWGISRMGKVSISKLPSCFLFGSLVQYKVTRRPDPDKYRDIYIPLHFRLLFQEEGTYQKKLYVKTFPFPSTNRGHQRYIGRKIQLSRPLSFPKGVLKSQLFYIV